MTILSVMRHIPASAETGQHVETLLNVAFGLAHELSELCLNLESSPAMRPHRFYGAQVADAGVSTLAHVACASATYTHAYRDRIEAARSIKGARETARSLDRLITLLHGHQHLGRHQTQPLVDKLSQVTAILVALDAALRAGTVPATRVG